MSDDEQVRGFALTFTLLVQEPTQVEATLSRLTADGWRAAWTTTHPPESFHLPLHLRGHVRDDSFTLPPSLLRRLEDSVGSAGGDLPLWVQLREPFGYLALLPWAALLEGVFTGPVLRLPTLSLPRRPPSDSLQVALLAAAPYERRSSHARLTLHSQVVTVARATPTLPATAAHRARSFARQRPPRSKEPLKAQHVDNLVRAILAGSPRRRTTIHVVTTPWIYDDLRLLWKGKRHPGRDQVTLHNPRSLAARLDQSPLGSSHNFWLRALALAQGGEQADVVHLVAHATVVQTSTRLVLPDSLRTRTSDLASRYVSSTALRAALDALGAWSVCVSSPPQNARVPQLRYFAARLVEQRPGPLLLTDLDADAECDDVRAGYRFLYAPEPAVPPRLEHGLLASEPHRVRGLSEVGGLSQVVRAPESERPHGAVSNLLSQDYTPAWVAGAQRFIEQQQMELARLERDAPVGSSRAEAKFRVQGVRDALSVLQAAIEEQAENPGRWR